MVDLASVCFGRGPHIDATTSSEQEERQHVLRRRTGGVATRASDLRSERRKEDRARLTSAGSIEPEVTSAPGSR
jgi:hypothetical protein